MSAAREADVARFFTNIQTPVVKDGRDHDRLDNRQRLILGRMVAISGIFIIALIAIPNPLWGRMVFLVCGAVVFAVGFLLFSSAVPEMGDGVADDAPWAGGSTDAIHGGKRP